MSTTCEEGLYFDEESMICRPCNSKDFYSYAWGLESKQCQTKFDTGGSYASVTTVPLDYPTYSTFSAACRENGAAVLNDTHCCPVGSSRNAYATCQPEDGLFAYYEGDGDYVNHFVTVSMLRCVAMGLVWDAEKARCTDETDCLAQSSGHIVSQARECTRSVLPAEGVVNISRVFQCKTGYWDIRRNACVSRVKCAFDRNQGAVLE